MAGKGEGSAIGIDLGTMTTPSYVAFTNSERLIDDAAKNQVAMNSINTIFGKFYFSFIFLFFYFFCALSSGSMEFFLLLKK
ncbi:hypothetical protein E5676_scaffold15G00140 [Cucumis melo var. makuwa]|uniref:Uncharacterized protein n=1 Tax=Cucumis melo var. makuwa TaxID=1194695 RepID=A0A5D3CSU6_CUCMM|nr:hypothetical protein E5676_scaffold15G00140 [Cucumis melo var. makuwa]